MAEPTLQEVFGPAALQDANTITISKADLARVGLTAAANNRAEAIFVALFLQAAQFLTRANQAANPDIQIVIAENTSAIVSRNNQQYRQFTYPVSLQKPEATPAIDPDDY